MLEDEDEDEDEEEDEDEVEDEDEEEEHFLHEETTFRKCFKNISFSSCLTFLCGVPRFFRRLSHAVTR